MLQFLGKNITINFLNYSVKNFIMNYNAHYLKVMILLNSAISRIKGMKADNDFLKSKGFEPSHLQNKFDDIADAISSYGNLIIENRKVVFRRWYPYVYLKSESGKKVHVPGTGQYEDEMKTSGIFHGWGVESEEIEGGVLTNTVAIIEFGEGEVQLVPVGYFKFVD